MLRVISIHALRVEGDCAFSDATKCSGLFLSTPSGWRATMHVSVNIVSDAISIHALRVEGDSHR